MIQQGLFARRTDPETSWRAAESVRHNTVTRTQWGILAVLWRHGAQTDEQIYLNLPVTVSQSGCRTRRKELVRAGLVEKDGHGKTAAGRKCKRWAITPDGSEWLVKLRRERGE